MIMAMMMTKMMMMMMMQGQPNFKPVSSGSALELHPQGNVLMCPLLWNYVQLQCNSASPHMGGEEVSLLVSGSAKSTLVLSLLTTVQCPHLGHNSIVHILRCNSIALMSTDFTEELVSFATFITV